MIKSKQSTQMICVNIKLTQGSQIWDFISMFYKLYLFLLFEKFGNVDALINMIHKRFFCIKI